MIFELFSLRRWLSNEYRERCPNNIFPHEKPKVFVHTLEKFRRAVNLMLSSRHARRLTSINEKDAVAQYGFGETPVHVVQGGADRNGTILEIIKAIEERYGESDEHVIVTHDSVRPFVKVSTIKANIEAAQKFGACDTVIPATDTIVESLDGECISSIPLRSNMYQGQTPQSFKVKTLKDLYASLTDAERAELTDACKILVLKGKPVHLVLGDVTNIKLTTIMDYKTAQAMIECGVDE